jgi:hypothetical protein
MGHYSLQKAISSNYIFSNIKVYNLQAKIERKKKDKKKFKSNGKSFVVVLFSFSVGDLEPEQQGAASFWCSRS